MLLRHRDPIYSLRNKVGNLIAIQRHMTEQRNVQSSAAASTCFLPFTELASGIIVIGMYVVADE